MSGRDDGPGEGGGLPDGSEIRVGSLPDAPPCPFCDQTRTELMNPFGSHASVATYWCRDCRSPFEILKWKGRS